MPDLMKEYTDVQIKIFALDQMFRALFPDSPFCSFTMNMGPQTVCFGHRDCWNLLFSTCPIGVLGPFNHAQGAILSSISQSP